MSAPTQHLLAAFDGHDIDGVRAALHAGADACSPIGGKLPIYWLLEEYHRTDRLPICLQLLFDRGAVMEDPWLAPVLVDDAEGIRAIATADPSVIHHRSTLVSAFTSLEHATLLHIAAEYGNKNAARALIDLGTDVNARAGVDKYGLGGHTPIFHTVNSNRNRSEPIMRMLLDAGADTAVRVDGLYWGRGYEWETIFFDVTPIAYAQMGLLPQVHRREEDIVSNIKTMLEASGREVPSLDNIPNRYLQPKDEHR